MLSGPVLPADLLASVRDSTEAAYSRWDDQSQDSSARSHGMARSSQRDERYVTALPPGEKFVATASSFTIGAIFPDDEISGLLSAIGNGEAGETLRRELGESVLCDRDQSWVRRQYAPSRYPRFHSPHGWHQDGALGFDFASHPDGKYPVHALLHMVTCWIALDDCGVDAPSLEFVTRPISQLLRPADLSDASIRKQFAAADFSTAKLRAGEGLVFKGNSLHRTFVTREMAKDRTSIELRFFSEAPERLKADRFVGVW